MANRSLYEVTVQLILAVAVVVIILMCIRMVVGADAMIALFIKSGGVVLGVAVMLLIVELPG